MKTWIAILRGINVGGARKLPMKDLKELLASLKCTEISTYIQSGNAVFKHGTADADVLAHRIGAAIQERFGFEVPVLIRSQDEMKKVAADDPYMKQADIALDKLHVTFLTETPSKALATAIEGTTFGNDSFVLKGREVYVHCPDGYGNSKLSNTWFESKLKVSATTRNWRTVNELVRMASEINA